MNTQDLKDRGQDLVRETENYVRGNPVPAILGAVALGIVIGLVARSLERDREPEPIRDALDELRAMLKPLAKKTRKVYANSSHAVQDAVNQAVERARDLDVGITPIQSPNGGSVCGRKAMGGCAIRAPCQASRARLLKNGLRRCLPWRSERAIHRDAYALFRNTAAFTSAGLMSLRSMPIPGSRSVAN